ncbi:MAG: hypothetical protein IJP34_05795 [Clostridia bacterium]|nr:hypothetical protein [Clostridia bacterium]
MKNTKKITLSALMAALAVVMMLVSYFPYLTYAVPAVAGLFIMIIVIELNIKWAILSYLSSAVFVFLFAETESKFMYIALLGYYPIVKALIEKIGKAFIEIPIKLILFNISVLAVYLLLADIVGISKEEFGEFGKWGAFILLGIGNFVFILYDITVSKIAALYIIKLHPRIKKLLM